DRKGAMDKSICRGIDFRPDDSMTREAPALEKVKRVLSKLRISGHWIADYFEVLIETGMRPAELLGVRGTDLRGQLLDIQPWTARQLKGKPSRRTIPLNDDARRILESHAERLFDKTLPI